MSVTRTARRRRAQAKNGYRHLDKMQRPRYKKVDAAKSERNLRKRLETLRRMQQKKAST